VITLLVNIGTGLGSNISTNYPNIGSLVAIILKNGLTVAGIILLGLIIFGGISYIMAAGEADQKKLAAATDTLTSAIIGFLVIFASYFIIQIIQVITGLKIL
jgi:hypothetical protein